MGSSSLTKGRTPGPPALGAHGVLATRPPGKSPKCVCVYVCIYIYTFYIYIIYFLYIIYVYFIYIIYIYIFFFLAVLGLHCCARAFSSCGERRLLFVAVHGLLIAMVSVVEHGL